jgi:Ca2+-binding RTX toxin-like protein
VLLLKARRRLGKPSVLLLTSVILGVSAASAIAASITNPHSSGNWTIIGTTGSDQISGGNANNTIIGLGGNDTISVGTGNNVIEGDGACSTGQDSITPFPGNAVYCTIHQITSSHTDTISAGSGSNIIAGGGYQNTISVGSGPNTIYAGGSHSNTVSAGNGANTIVGGSGPNTISVGNGNDTIFAGGGPDTISTGTGGGTIYAQNGQIDHITCASSNSYTVYADKSDVVKNCKKVTTALHPVTAPAFTALIRLHRGTTTTVKHTHKHVTKHRKKHAGKKATKHLTAGH